MIPRRRERRQARGLEQTEVWQQGESAARAQRRGGWLRLLGSLGVLRVLAVLSVLSVTALLGCAGVGFDGRVYRGEGFAFRVPPRPGTWTPLEATGSALAFRTAAGGTVAVGGRCAQDGDDVPLQALTQHLFLHFTERVIDVQERVPFDGREALHTELSAKLDGVQHRFDVWVLKKDGCVYDLYYLARPEAFAQDRDLFRSFVSGFGTVADGG